MRYLLVLVGIVCAGAGMWRMWTTMPSVDGAPLEIRYALLVQAGVVFIAAGLATIDIVDALRRPK